MTPKEKATKLVGKFLPYVDSDNGSVHDPGYSIEEQTKNAKQCALIAVDLHLDELSKMKLIFSDREIHFKNLQQVKQEIEKL